MRDPEAPTCPRGRSHLVLWSAGYRVVPDAWVCIECGGAAVAGTSPARPVGTAVADIVAVAEQLAREKHAGQVDKQGRPYADAHLAPVAAHLRMFGPEAEAAGWLHDLIEDTDSDCRTLVEAGMPRNVIDAVWAVTRRDGEPYTDMVNRAANDPLGRLVKLADNWVNLTGLDALAVTDPETAARLRRRYEPARRLLLLKVGAL